MNSPAAGRFRVLARARIGAGLALLAAGQMTGWIALTIAAWDLWAGGNSYQTGRIGSVLERLFPAFWLLAGIGTALAARWMARREGRQVRPWFFAAILLTTAVGIATYATGWRLLGLPIHAVRGALGEATFATVALVEIAIGMLVLVGRGGR